MGAASSAAGLAAIVALLLLAPAAGASFTLIPNYAQGCNGNPYGTWLQYAPIGYTTHNLLGPVVVGGGYLAPGVSGNQTARTIGGTNSSALTTAEYFMVGPHKGNTTYTCYVPPTTRYVSATYTWAVNWSAYLGANCTGTASAVATYDIFITGNFHIANPPYYLTTPISNWATVSAFVVGCGGPYAPGWKFGIFSVTTPNVHVIAGASYDLYTAIWVTDTAQTHVPMGSTGAAYSGVTWNAQFNSVTCNGC